MSARKIRTIFAGTPDFAVPSLRCVMAHPALDLVAVYTQPDRPAGRGRKLTQSPVKQIAAAAGLTVEQPERVTTPEALATFTTHAPELFIVAAYGLLLPTGFIDAPVTAINVHASLLPRWRGAAPIQRAIMAGDQETGISIMRVVLKLDAGPVWLRRACPIGGEETGGTLHDRLATLGAEALDAALGLYLEGRVAEEPQDESSVTYAAKIVPADRQLDWNDNAAAIARRVRALAPSPAAVGRLGALEVKVLAGTPSTNVVDAAPGTVLAHGTNGIVVATADGTYTINTLQPAGKQRMSAQAFSNGYGHLL